MEQKFPTNIQRCVLRSLASSPQSYFLISAHRLLHLFPAGPLPLMASFLEPSFHTVSNAAESLERCLPTPSPAVPTAQASRATGRAPPAYWLPSLAPAMPTSPKLWQPTLKRGPVTLKQQHISVWVLHQPDWNHLASLPDNDLNKKFSLKTQTLQTTSWSPNLNQENSSLSKYDLGMKLILIMRDKKCCMGESKNYLSLVGGEIR